MLTGSLGKMENEKLCKFVIFTQYYDTIKSRRKRCIRERNAGKISVIPTDWKWHLGWCRCKWEMQMQMEMGEHSWNGSESSRMGTCGLDWSGSAQCPEAGFSEQGDNFPILYKTGNVLTRYKIDYELSKDSAHAVTVEQRSPAWPVRRHPSSAYLCTVEMTVLVDWEQGLQIHLRPHQVEGFLSL